MKPSHRRTLAIASVSGIMSGALFPLFAILLGHMFSAFSEYDSGHIHVTILRSRVTTNAIYLCLFAMASWILRTTFFIYSQRFGELQAMAARLDIFDGMLLREMVWFDRHNLGAATLGTLQRQVWVYSFVIPSF